MNKKIVSVIITTKNEQNNLGSCLESIKNQSYKNIEIIVVDNSSSDLTKEIAFKYTKLVFDKGPERSAQRNYGAKRASGEFVVFIDADMILSDKVIEECVDEFANNKLGGVIIPEKSIGSGYWTKVKAFERSLYEGDNSIEAARFFESSVFWEVGGYDENITGPEDWDLPQRVKNKYQIGRIRSYILHNEGRTSLFILAKKKYYYGLKTSKYISKNPTSKTLTQVVYFLRPAFYRNWKKLCKNPMLTAGMIVMLFVEQCAGFLGVLRMLLVK